ncbi:hypothetical protein JOQ06_029744, partial [Pogonophryne albipinna]
VLLLSTRLLSPSESPSAVGAACRQRAAGPRGCEHFTVNVSFPTRCSSWLERLLCCVLVLVGQAASQWP